MQDESTKDMIFDVARLVSYASQTARLLPGDLVLTGSPAGNGMHWGRLLRDGDVMDGSVTGLGAQRTRCVAEEARDAASTGPTRGRDRRGRQGVLELGPLGRGRRARHAQLPRRRPSAARARPWSAAASASRSSQRFDMDGPQKGWRRRTNPVHTMLDTGTDAALGNQGFPHGIGGADDVIAMPLQCSTQWDGLGHIFDHGKAWNGRAGREGRHLRRRPGHRHRAHGAVRRRARRAARRGPGRRRATANCPTASPSPRST